MRQTCRRIYQPEKNAGDLIWRCLPEPLRSKLFEGHSLDKPRVQLTQNPLQLTPENLICPAQPTMLAEWHQIEILGRDLETCRNMLRDLVQPLQLLSGKRRSH